MGLEVLEYFFCCTLLACHEGRGRSPSVSEMGEKTDFLTFQLNCKNIQQINKLCKQTNYCQGGVVEDGNAETVAVPVRCTNVMGASRYHRRRVHWYGYSVIVDNGKTTNDNRSPVRQTRLAELTACWLESASNLTNPALAETCETYRRSNLRVHSASSQ